jgi:isoleucyl-tRNA synthetase
MDEHGADAVRWFMAASGSPWASRRIGPVVIQEVVRKVLLTYWNTVAFQSLYARSAGWTPGTGAPGLAERPVLDRWLAGQTAQVTRDVTAALEAFDTQRAGQLLSRFVDDLSNWYVRRSRRRFWAGEPAAFATLHESLEVLTRLMAPITPFLTEHVWQDMVAPVDPRAARSVHLSRWPTYDEGTIDDALAAGMALARRVVELGRSARAEAKVKTRQPLNRALVGVRTWSRLSAELRAEVADELNVGSLEPLAGPGGDLVEYSVKADFRSLGKRFGKATPQVAAALSAADATSVAGQLAGAGSVPLEVDGRTVVLEPGDVIVTERPAAGWSVVNEHGETVALDLELTPELVRAGLAREVVRTVQEARKQAGLDISDRVRMWWQADGELAAALREHEALVAAEVLAVQMSEGTPDDGSPAARESGLGLSFWLRPA